MYPQKHYNYKKTLTIFIIMRAWENGKLFKRLICNLKGEFAMDTTGLIDDWIMVSWRCKTIQSCIRDLLITNKNKLWYQKSIITYLKLFLNASKRKKNLKVKHCSFTKPLLKYWFGVIERTDYDFEDFEGLQRIKLAALAKHRNQSPVSATGRLTVPHSEEEEFA